MVWRVPERPKLEGLEDTWAASWEEDGTYRFDRSASRDQVYSIDTPPPTVSGSLHVGHVFSFTHTDTMARYKRMRGYQVFYPMGWDDNGLATERRVQNYYGVRCDPGLAYQAGFEPPARGGLGRDQQAVAVSRPNFIELCEQLVAEDERAFEALFRRLGLSVDWTQHYTTIGEAARRASQRGFLRLLARGEAYSAEAPTLWDVDFRTAVAQAELEDRELAGAYYRLAFHRGDGAGDVLIDTTRPELLAACVALVVHPEDERYRALVGTGVRTPVFGVDVPVVAHPLAQPDKGTGAAMICTFGDVTDVVWWRELALPLRAIVGRDGRLLADPPVAFADRAAELYRERLGGRTVRQAQAGMVDLLRDTGELLGDPRPVRHAVKFYEKGDHPLEIVTSRQWFFRTLKHREDLLARGRQLRWHPRHMEARYANWVEGLNTDWLVSRQRFFGVPFPVWYRLDSSGDPDYDHPLLPAEADLPVDPTTDVPAGFEESDRGRPGGFDADPDVMDTWATSSLTPQIAGRWVDDPDLFARVFPMDLRPQAHDIIRTWLFATVVRSHLEFDRLPWSDVAISGWILDPDRKKMSKSKGNVITPMDLLERHGSDAVRYWAASGRPGTDTAFDDGQMKVGRRLAIKILNVSRFVLELAARDDPDAATAPPAAGRPLEPIDAGLLRAVADLVEEATAAFEGYDYARALERTEALFWTFCDDYVELVKSRAYGDPTDDRVRSARAALRQALSVLLRLFAPVLPFVTEEVWSWWHDAGSIHRAPWPVAADVGGAGGDPALLGAVGAVLSQVRRVKSTAGVTLRAPVKRVSVTAPSEHIARLSLVADDLRQAGVIDDLRWIPSEAATEPVVDVELG